MVHEQLARFYSGFRRDAHPMAVLVGVVGALSAFYHEAMNWSDEAHRDLPASSLVAKMPTIVAMAYTYGIGLPFVRLVQTWSLPAGAEVTVRPIRPEDAELQKEFVKALSAQDKYYPFLNTLREITDTVAARLTQIDYDREMALSATVDKEGREVQVGVCRYTANADAESCEFAIVVADEWQRKGLARKLMGVLIETARERGLKYMNGAFLATDERMLQFASGSGFVIADSPDEHSIKHGVLTL